MVKRSKPTRPSKSGIKLTKQTQGQAFKLEGVSRQIFLKPERALKEAEIKPGQVIADLGSGSGYLTIPAAVMVGRQGLVYAVDVLKDDLAGIKSQAKMYGLPNISTVWADLEVAGSTKIAAESVDITFLFKVLCQAKRRGVIFAEAVRITKPGGKIMIAEWCEPKVGTSPKREGLLGRKELLALGANHALKLEHEHKLDDFHYILEYRRPDGSDN